MARSDEPQATPPRTPLEFKFLGTSDPLDWCLSNALPQVVRGCSVPDEGRTMRRGCPTSAVYLSGPMRGIEDFNFHAFDEARDRMLGHGFAVISPADIDRADREPPSVKQMVMRDTTALCLLCPENGDFIYMLPGWEGSVGAVTEFYLARWLGLPPFHYNLMPVTDLDWAVLAETTKRWMVDALDITLKGGR